MNGIYIFVSVHNVCVPTHGHSIVSIVGFMAETSYTSELARIPVLARDAWEFVYLEDREYQDVALEFSNDHPVMVRQDKKSRNYATRDAWRGDALYNYHCREHVARNFCFAPLVYEAFVSNECQARFMRMFMPDQVVGEDVHDDGTMFETRYQCFPDFREYFWNKVANKHAKLFCLGMRSNGPKYVVIWSKSRDGYDFIMDWTVNYIGDSGQPTVFNCRIM